MPISPNFTSIYSKDWEINFMQCTPNGYLKYTDLCNIMQLTAASHSEIGGISFVDMQQFDQAWVLSRMRVEITELPKWKDIVIVKTWIVSLDNSKSVRAMEVFLNEKKIISCETFWAVMNTKTRRPEALAINHGHFEKFPTKFATKLRVSRIDFEENEGIINSKKVVFSDLDIVNHANSVKYLEWCLDCIDENLILNQKLMSFDMNYLKELSLNDFVTIKENSTDFVSIFNVTKQEKTSFLLKLNWK